MLGALVGLLLLVVLIDSLLGRGVPVDRFLGALTDPDSLDGQILILVRVPRVMTAVLAGAALGVAGVVLQAVLRNPLASPDLTGVNSAAVLGVVTVIAFSLVPLDDTIGMLGAALLAGLVGGSASWLLAGRLGPERQLLIGVLVAAAAGGMITVFLALRASQFGSVLRWLIGSVDGRVWADLRWAAPWIVAWVAVLALAGGVLSVLLGGDGHAAGLGVPPVRTRGLLLIAAVALAAGAAALAGAITFIGLAVPHLVRSLIGSDTRWAVPYAAVIGAILLCGCDALAQLVTGFLAGADISQRAGVPAGAVAALLGAVVLVGAVRRIDAGSHRW